MTTDQNIRMQNLFCMLSYVFRVLNQTNYDEVRLEQFEDAEDLFAAVLAKAVGRQVKHGLCREYRSRQETLSVMRGKLNVPETLRRQIQHQQRLSCEFDELAENNLLNQILKTTLQCLLQCPRVKPARQRELKRLLLHFGAVELLRPAAIPWNRLPHMGGSRTYALLIRLCRLVLGSLLEPGDYPEMGLPDDQMARLFEAFLLEYCRSRYPGVQAGLEQVPWDLRESPDLQQMQLLPALPRQLLVRCGSGTLVLDARYESDAAGADALLELYASVKNLDVDGTGTVAGILLLVRTGERRQPDSRFDLGGSRIGVETLNLNRSFSQICSRLDRLLLEFLGVQPRF